MDGLSNKCIKKDKDTTGEDDMFY